MCTATHGSLPLWEGSQHHLKEPYLFSKHVPQVDQRQPRVVVIVGYLHTEQRIGPLHEAGLVRLQSGACLTCASRATPLVISSKADVASEEKRSSPDGEDHKRYTAGGSTRKQAACWENHQQTARLRQPKKMPPLL